MKLATYWNVQTQYIFLSLLIFSLSPLSAQIVYVDLNAPGTQNGNDWTNAYSTIQDGINDASGSGGQVWVAAGIYEETNVTSNGLTLASNVHVYGGFSGTETLLSQRNAATNVTEITGVSNDRVYHVVTINNVTNSRLEGFTITKGGAGGGSGDQNNGGGIFCISADSSNIVENCIIADSSIDSFGSGIYCRNSALTFLNCVIKDNVTAGSGGGIAIDSSNGVSVINCIITGNQSDITFSTIGSGSAFYCNDSSPNIIHCTIDGNSDAFSGSIALMTNATPNIINCIISNEVNSAGIFEHDASSDPQVTNSLFFNNTAGDYINEASTTLNGIQINTLAEATGNIAGNPLYVNSGVGDFHLQTGSPALDTGIDVTTTIPLSLNDFEIELRGSDGDAAGAITADGSDFDIGADELFVPAPGIIVSPALLDFGELEIDSGTTGPLALNIFNTGNFNLTFSSIEIIGVQTTNFSFDSGPDTSPLVSGSSRTIELLFDPSTIGTKSASLRIVSDATNSTTETVTLSGIGIANPVIELASTTSTITNGSGPLEMGTADEGSLSLSLIITTTNNGSSGALLSITDLSVSTPFIIVESLDSLITGGTSDTFQIDLPTTNAGDYVGIVSITSNDSVNPLFQFTVHGLILDTSGGENEPTTRANHWHLIN